MSSVKNRAARNKAKRAVRREFLAGVDRLVKRREHDPFPASKDLRQLVETAKLRPELAGRLPVGINGAINEAMRRERRAEKKIADKLARAKSHEAWLAKQASSLAAN